MTSNPLVDARDTLAAYLDPLLTNIAVYPAMPNKLARNTVTAVVHATDASWAQHRDLISIEIDLFAPYNRTGKGDTSITAAVGDTYIAVRGFATDPYRWGGPGSATDAVIHDEGVTIDGTDFAMGTINLTVVNERPAAHARGPLEDLVCEILTDADLPVKDVITTGDTVIVRAAGSPAGDPYYDMVGVWAVTDFDSGRTEALYRRVWDALYASNQVTVVSDVTVAYEGVPPSADLTHSVAEMMVRGNTER